MSYLGDLPLGGSVTLLFTTVNSSGVPTSMTGTSQVVIYRGTNVSEILGGITFMGDFDGRVGLHAVQVLTGASPVEYTSGSMFSLILSSGFLAGASLSNYMLGNFSINARSALRPETPGAVLTLTPTGEAGINWARIANSTTAQNLSATTIQAVNSNVTVGTNNDKTGYALGIGGFIAGAAATDSFTDTAASAAYNSEIAIAVGNREVETIGHYTADQIGRLVLAALAGVTTTGGVIFMAPDGTTVRITATVNASNERTAVVLTP